MTKPELCLAVADAWGQDRCAVLSPPSGSRQADGFDADVVVVGAGFAGALIALLTMRQGRSTIVVDPNPVHPGDFRCEKLSLDQARLIVELGIGQAFGLAPDGDPHGLTRKGFAYDEMVNGLRRLWPSTGVQVVDKVTAITPSAQGVRAILAGGRVLSCKLLVLATGLGERLRADLGLTRRVLSPAHSVSLGLTLEGPSEVREALIGRVQLGERLGDGVGYASFFSFGANVRLNLFLYDPPQSERVARFRRDPIGELGLILPRLTAKLRGMRVVGPVDIRVTDLYTVEKPARDGVVLIGDARRTSCPASGSGVTRILHDAKRLDAQHLPAWFGSHRFDAASISAFYDDPALAMVDRRAHRQSMNGRRAATSRSIYWRLRRLARTARKRLARGEAPADAGPAAPPPRGGDRVVVRSAQDILATLDADGRLDALPFMPEMIAYIGREMKVARRIERTCVEGRGMRGLSGVVTLEAARCDGATHDGCQRGCMMLWKTAWLRPIGEAPAVDAAAETLAIARLAALPTRTGEVYTCQSTQLAQATRPLPNLPLAQLLRETVGGDLDPFGLFRILGRTAGNRLRAAIGLPELDLIVGRTEKPSKGGLGLQPGDWVRVKSQAEVRAALDASSRNRGLSFEPEMSYYLGTVHRVSDVVERIIDERKGKMVRLERTVVLERIYCQGLCNKGCPRQNPLFWREAWLERVEPPHAPGLGQP